MINLRIPPKNPKELYEFFMEVARTPVKSHVAYVGGIPYVRENWMIYTYLSKPNSTYSLYFHDKESEPAKWYEVYKKYIYENATTCKHR